MKTEFIEVSPQAGLLIGSTMLVAGLLFIGWKFDRISTEISSLRWHVTSGIIEDSNFYTSKRKSSNTTSSTHHGEVTYRYSVDDHEYVGRRYDSTGSMHTGLESEAEEFEGHISGGSVIDVFYNPNDPSQSLLKNGISEDTYVRIVFSSFLSIVGLIVLRYQWKRYKIQQTEQVEASDRSPR